jgi:hypothetical protein
VPVEYKEGDIATFRNVPRATKDAIALMSWSLKKTQGEVIAEAVEVYASRLIAEGRLADWGARVARSAASATAEQAARRTQRQGSRKRLLPSTSKVQSISAQASTGNDDPGRCTASPSVEPASGVIHRRIASLSDAEFNATLVERRRRRDELMGREALSPTR